MVSEVEWAQDEGKRRVTVVFGFVHIMSFSHTHVDSLWSWIKKKRPVQFVKPEEEEQNVDNLAEEVINKILFKKVLDLKMLIMCMATKRKEEQDNRYKLFIYMLFFQGK